SDAYSTGEAVFALRESGAGAPRGIRFLLSTQQADGTWHVRTRMVSPAEVSPPYFETGFPYKKDQFISYAGSCWATLALLSTVPAKPELSRIPGVRIQEPIRRANSPFDDLTAAASYYGNSKEVARLLDAGASPNPPAGPRAHNTPLRYAAMSGDLPTVQLLLSHGADPNAASPLAEAITFGHPEVASALIAAGADVDGVESTGVNLLHWATITNRPALIPVLVKAGVPLNETDENGFTPLMYAATIDFGDTKALDALLAAGADPNIKDLESRTALQQARRLGHAQLAAKLTKRAR
ncbi:MAG: ankyrin repeat domain-containing protein, partial [Acidobacteriota bacterium]